MLNVLTPDKQSVNAGDNNISTYLVRADITKENTIELIEELDPNESKNKVSKINSPTSEDRDISSIRKQSLVINIVDLNIVPIDIHSLMREIPLINLYNYAYSFDEHINRLYKNNENNTKLLNRLLLEPYTQAETLSMVDNQLQIDSIISDAKPEITKVKGVNMFNSSDIISDGSKTYYSTKYKFLYRQLYKRVLLADIATNIVTPGKKNQRFNSKLFKNVLFLCNIQEAIRDNVKKELEYINSKVVTNVQSVAESITHYEKNKAYEQDEEDVRLEF